MAGSPDDARYLSMIPFYHYLAAVRGQLVQYLAQIAGELRRCDGLHPANTT